MKSLEQFSSEEKTYLPSEEVRKELSRVPLVCIVGGVGVGKNYLMHRAGLPIVGRVTSRPKRPDDDPSVYTYYTNEEFARMIERRELVQYAVDLRNSVIYGSTLKNYAFNTPNLADIWHWSVAELPEKGFASVRAVSIITPWEQWKAQLEARFAGRDASYRASRLAEAAESLEWTRTHLSDSDHTVIVNDQAHAAESIQRLTAFANHTIIPTLPEASALIDDLLTHLRTLTT